MFLYFLEMLMKTSLEIDGNIDKLNTETIRQVYFLFMEGRK